MFVRLRPRTAIVVAIATVAVFIPHLARAVPSFALQTGQPCVACHIGAYGPQLTAFGRAFKIGGYTQTGGDGSQGRNSYTDYALDGGYQYTGDGTNIVSALGIFNHETQTLNGAFNSGGSSQAGNTLNQARASLTYYYQQTYGFTAAWQRTWGTANPLLYAAAPITGSANGKPNSNAFILEADWVPFGKADSVASPWVNLELGVQYTIYTQFNGAAKNYDGFGRDASDNNTLYAFAWLIF